MDDSEDLLDSSPIPSMYGIFTYIWLMFMGDVGKCRYIFHTWMLWEFFLRVVLFL